MQEGTKTLPKPSRATASKFGVVEDFEEVVLGEGGAEEAFLEAAPVGVFPDKLQGKLAHAGVQQVIPLRTGRPGRDAPQLLAVQDHLST